MEMECKAVPEASVEMKSSPRASSLLPSSTTLYLLIFFVTSPPFLLSSVRDTCLVRSQGRKEGAQGLRPSGRSVGGGELGCARGTVFLHRPHPVK